MSGIKLPCPSCQHNAFWYTEHNGFGYCFYCEYSERTGQEIQQKQKGDISTFRTLYTEIVAWYHKQLKKEHRQYLNQRGITNDTIDQFQLGYCSDKSHILYTHPVAFDAGIVTQEKKPILQNRIVFPYIIGKQVTDIRGRLYKGDGERYLSLLGSTHYRGAVYAYNCNTLAKEILITEGEIKALAACQLGYHAVGLSGILSKRVTSLADTEKQYICFDSQLDMWHVKRAIQQIAKNQSNPYLVTLPLHGKEKQDIDSYILSYGANSFHTLIKYARRIT